MAVPIAPNRRLAVDTNFLLDLADRQEAALTLQEVLAERKIAVGVPPTVIQELSLLLDSPAPEKAALALRALQSIRQWGFTPYDLKAVGHGITEVFSRALIRKGYLPAEEFNDGCILAEAALASVGGLITSDNHLLQIDQSTLNGELLAADLPAVAVLHPKHLLRSLAPPVKRPAKY